MKTDIDQLMGEANLDALLVSGPAGHNPYMTYFTGLVHVTHSYLLKKRGDEPVLFHSAMERDEAASTGLGTKDLTDYDTIKILKEAGGDHIRARAMLLQRFFEEYGVHGRVGVYGKVEVGPLYAALNLLDEVMTDIEIVGDMTRPDGCRKNRHRVHPR